MATEKQIEALRVIRSGGVTMKNFGTGAYRICGDIHPAVVGRCVASGWAIWPKGPVAEQTCEITPAGEELVAGELKI